MKRKGFTLIELLAVIVVLAIIALIATPIVMNVIKNASKGAAERSAERYLDAVETAIATDRLENSLIADGTYNIDTDGNLCLEGKTCVEPDLIVEVSGDKPTSGTIAIQGGQVQSSGTSMKFGKYTVIINAKGEAVALEGDVNNSIICRAVTPTLQSVVKFDGVDESYQSEYIMTSQVVGIRATESAPYALGAEYSCDLGDGARTFYVLKEEGDNVYLIMNENFEDVETTWCLNGADNSCNADGARDALSTATSNWTKLTEVGGAVDLPTNSLLSVVPYKNSKIIYVNLVRGSSYWTSTANLSSEQAGGPMSAYVVMGNDGTPIVPDGDIRHKAGIRPVITIPKSNMSL